MEKHSQILKSKQNLGLGAVDISWLGFDGWVCDYAETVSELPQKRQKLEKKGFCSKLLPTSG